MADKTSVPDRFRSEKDEVLFFVVISALLHEWPRINEFGVTSENIGHIP